MPAGRTLFLVACALVLSACGGGGGNKSPSYTITASQSSVSLHHLAGGLLPTPFQYQGGHRDVHGPDPRCPGHSGLATGGSLVARLDDTRDIPVENPQQSAQLGMVVVTAPFSLTVTRQPQNQRCIFNNGETTTSGTGSPADALITVASLYCNTTLMPWTWMRGSQTAGAQPAFWSDSSGRLWLFGGDRSYRGKVSDVWRFEPQ
jgi:hypothetical protein